MAQPTKEPCKKQACDIQACLSKNNFLPQRTDAVASDIVSAAFLFLLKLDIVHVAKAQWCVKVIQLLQSCCEQCEYKSTHCASVAGILKQINK